MTGKILIVEDEPVIALDLEQELEQSGMEVVALAQSSDEALVAVEESLPDLVLMDVNILGSLDGIATAKLLRDAYQIPSVFLTAFSDDRTVSRAVREMPYGYLTKPFQSRELNATVQVALYKAKVDAGLRGAKAKSDSALNGMHEALVALSLEGEIMLMNTSAEQLTGIARENAVGLHFRDVLDLEDHRSPLIFSPALPGLSGPVERFGLSLRQPGRSTVFVDLAIAPTLDMNGAQTGYILTLRRSEQRLHSETGKDPVSAAEVFEQAIAPMMQLDSSGHVVRVNEAMLRDCGVAEDKLVGRTLAGLKRDPDPRISGKLMSQLLDGPTP